MTVFDNPQERVLNQIFTEFLIPVHAVKETVQGFFIAREEQTHFVQVAIANFLHQSIISKCFQIRFSGGLTSGITIGYKQSVDPLKEWEIRKLCLFSGHQK